MIRPTYAIYFLLLLLLQNQYAFAIYSCFQKPDMTLIQLSQVILEDLGSVWLIFWNKNTGIVGTEKTYLLRIFRHFIFISSSLLLQPNTFFFFLVVKHKPNCQKINFGFSTFLNEIYLYSLGMY